MAGRSRRAWFSVLLGLVVGFTLASRLILPKASELKKAGQKRKANPAGCGLNRGLIREYGGIQWPPQDNGSPATENPGARSNNFLFVGVMTAQKYLNSRAVAAHRTWAQTIPGRVEFFSSEGSDTSIPIPIVALRNVDDSYPPQKKSFMMLKYMHDHYLDKYEWFMRADDDPSLRTAHRAPGIKRNKAPNNSNTRRPRTHRAPPDLHREISGRREEAGADR